MDSAGGSSDSLNNWHEHVVDPFTRASAQAGSSKLKTAWVSTEMEGTSGDDDPVENTALNTNRSRSRVEFSLDNPGPSSPPRHESPSPPFRAQNPCSPPLLLSDLPPGFVPTGTPSYTPTASSATFGSPRADSSSFVVPPPPPHVPHSVPTFSMPQSPPMQIAPQPAIDSIHVPPYPPPPPRGVEITPKVIAKAQKHCRFAISALDYEDAQHAIKELKAALETLGASV